MSMQRFATDCDTCGQRSLEYASWPICRDCQQHVCPACDVPSARSEDEDHRTLCQACAALVEA